MFSFKGFGKSFYLWGLVIFELLFLSYGKSTAQFLNNRQLLFESINKEHGLKHSNIVRIYEDSQGYLWFGTFGGLHRYDGTSFTYYHHIDSISTSIADNNIYSVFEDSKKRIWVGSENGLSLFVPELNGFQNFNSENFGFGKFGLRQISEDKQGYLWIATYGGGIAKFNPDTKQLLGWFRKENASLEGNYVNTVFVSRDGNVYAGLESKGLHCLKRGSASFVVGPKVLSAQTINAIQEDEHGDLWIGTWVEGLFLYEPSTLKVRNFPFQSNVQTSVPDPTIRDIVFDKTGNLWLATPNGMGYFDTRKFTCATYRNNRFDVNSLSFDFVWSVYVDREGVVWGGTFGNGIVKVDPNKNSFTRLNAGSGSCSLNETFMDVVFTDSQGRIWVASSSGGFSVYTSSKTCVFESKVGDYAKDKKIRSFYEGENGYVWMGTDKGVIRCDKEIRSFCSIPLKDGENGLSVFSVNEDRNGNVWFGGWNTGLLKLSSESKFKPLIRQEELVKYSMSGRNERKIPSDIVWKIFRDSSNVLWVATSNELIRYKEVNASFESVLDGKVNVTGLYEYPRGTIWVSSLANGLFYFRPKEGDKVYTLSSELLKAGVYGFVHKGSSFWLATEKGLCSFNLESKKVGFYTMLDGLPSNTFLRCSAAMANNGAFVFGTPKGAISFFSEELPTSFSVPKARIDDVRLFNSSLSREYSSSPRLLNSLNYTKEVKLEYDQNVLSICFSAIQHSLPEKVRYSYLLEGFHKDWVETNFENRVATFTNLDPGTYVFRVRASLQGFEDKYTEATIQLVVLPPWWKTIWFRLGIVLFLVVSSIGLFYLRTDTIRKRALQLEKQVEERTLELKTANGQLHKQNEEVKKKSDMILAQQKELLDKKYSLEKTNGQLSEWNEFQQRLIGIIGHDIRGPIHRLNALVQLSKTEDDKVYMAEKIKETASSLSLLASDLVSWVSLQSSKTGIEEEVLSWGDCIEKVKSEVKEEAKDKDITLSIFGDAQKRVIGVPQIVLAACRNVLVNAIRYSAKGATIEIEIGVAYKGLSAIRITDFGKGFDAKEVNKLIHGDGFKGMRSVSLQEGAGLGLTICNDMLKKIGGFMEAASLMGSGATFYICLPEVSLQEKSVVPDLEETIKKKDGEVSLKDKVILLVDDDDEVRWLLVHYLSNFTTVFEVRSAEEALDWMKDNTPDLAILDIHMPGISGLELCRRIKKSPDTAHVPCLLITGEVTESSRMEVLNAGANAFLPKPFTSEEMLLQLQSYFENYERQLKRFFQESIPVDEFTDNELNRAFLTRLLEVVETNLSSPELSIDFLTKQLGMSKSTLYRKLTALTGQSANGFIKNIRMRKSLVLLKESQLNIAEIAMEVGFGSASYFTTAFRKHFGFNPNEVKK